MLGEPIRFDRGVNSDTSELALEPGFVKDSRNFLFRGRKAVSRPGAPAANLGNAASLFPISMFPFQATGLVDYVYIFMQKSATLYELYVARVYDNGSGVAFDELGAASGALDYTFVPIAPSSYTVVNGVPLIGGVRQGGNFGILRVDKASGTLTLIAQDYYFVTSCLARAVAAREVTGTASAPFKVAWSVDGDETDWTGVGSGSTVLSDSHTGITALGSLRNVVIVGHRDGFHLGNPTGTSLPAFSWTLVSKESVGVSEPASFAMGAEKAYFISEGGVYTFDTNRVESIGQPIDRELLYWIKRGVRFRGDVGLQTGEGREMYFLTPVATSSSFLNPTLLKNLEGVPQYVFDDVDKVWSKHEYEISASNPYVPAGVGDPTDLSTRVRRACGFANTSFNTKRFALLDGSNFRAWYEEADCEREQYVVSPTARIPEDRNLTSQRAVLTARTAVDETQVTVTVRGNQENNYTSMEKTNGLKASQNWRRRWFNGAVVTGPFEAEVRVAAGSKVELDSLRLDLTDAGEFLGEDS